MKHAVSLSRQFPSSGETYTWHLPLSVEAPATLQVPHCPIAPTLHPPRRSCRHVEPWDANLYCVSGSPACSRLLFSCLLDTSLEFKAHEFFLRASKGERCTLKSHFWVSQQSQWQPRVFTVTQQALIALSWPGSTITLQLEKYQSSHPVCPPKGSGELFTLTGENQNDPAQSLGHHGTRPLAT